MKDGAVIVREYLDGLTWKLEYPDQEVVCIHVSVWREIAERLGWEEEVDP